MLLALFHGVRGEVRFADRNDAGDDRNDLCDAVVEGTRRGWTLDPVSDVLNVHHDGVRLGFEIRLEAKGSTIRKAIEGVQALHL